MLTEHLHDAVLNCCHDATIWPLHDQVNDIAIVALPIPVIDLKSFLVAIEIHLILLDVLYVLYSFFLFLTNNMKLNKINKKISFLSNI